MANWQSWSLVLLAGLNNCIGSLLLKKSRLAASDLGLGALLFSPWFMGGILFFGINVVIFAKALDKLPVSAAYPVLAGVGFALITCGGGWFFGERLTLNQFVGGAAILAGIIVMTQP